LAPDDLREIYEVLIAIEASAAELDAQLPAQERALLADELAEATGAMEAALAASDLAGWGHADAAFHRLIVERCGNTRFIRILQTVNDQSHRARMLTLRLRPQLDVSAGEHRALLGAIRAGDAEAAREAARLHRVRARDELLPLIASFGLRHL
jgi:DNA-binding GntR family transcriptional regulator